MTKKILLLISFLGSMAATNEAYCQMLVVKLKNATSSSKALSTVKKLTFPNNTVLRVYNKFTH